MEGQLVAFLQGDDAAQFDEEFYHNSTRWTKNDILSSYITELGELGELGEVELAGTDYIAYHSLDFVVVNSGINGLYRAIYKL